MSTSVLSTSDIPNLHQSRSENGFAENTKAFYEKLPAQNVEPLWLALDRLVPPKPNPQASVAIWRYGEVRPTLMEAGKLVSVEEAERRVLMLVNPSLKSPQTTDTIYGGLQLIFPGETAPAHRHSAFALRFVIEGSYGFTAVDGEKMVMQRGDVILTPSWQWHDHGNEGTGPVIWLDGLDLPVFNLFHLNFAAQYPKPRYPSTFSNNCTSQFPWSPVEETLRASAGTYARYHYKFDNGDHLSQTLSVQAERISAGSSSPESQETVSFIYHVVEGEGHSIIQTSDKESPSKITWSSKDTFTVPAWSRITHTCTLTQDNAFLVAVNDRPMVESLGLFRDASSFSIE